jgi:hypothetical protein
VNGVDLLANVQSTNAIIGTQTQPHADDGFTAVIAESKR